MSKFRNKIYILQPKKEIPYKQIKENIYKILKLKLKVFQIIMIIIYRMYKSNIDYLKVKGKIYILLKVHNMYQNES